MSIDRFGWEPLGWTLLHFVWQGIAVGLVALILLRVARAWTPAARYRVTAALMLILATCPVATLMYLSQQAATSAEVAGPQIVAVAPQVPALPAPEPEIVDVEPEIAVDPGFVDAVAAMPPADASVESVSDAPSSVDAWSIAPFLPYIQLVWVGGVCLLTLRLCGGWLKSRRLTKRGVRPVSQRWAESVDRLQVRLGVRRAVRCLESATAQVPMVVGWLRPVIVVPGCILTGLSPAEVECLLAHELAHIRRHDYLVNLAQCLVEVLLFYHPVVWWISHRLRHERECLCDALAIEATGDSVAYSRALLSAAEMATKAPPLAVAATQGELSGRVRSILGMTPPSGWASGWIVLALAGAVLCAVGSLMLPSGESGDADAEDEIELPFGAVQRYGAARGPLSSGPMAFRADGSLVVPVRSSGEISFGQRDESGRPAAIVDPETGDVLKRVGPDYDPDVDTSVAAISGDGSRMIVSRTPSARVWMTRTGFPSTEYDVYSVETNERLATLGAHTVDWGGGRLAFSDDGRFVAMSIGGHFADTPTIAVYDATTGEVLHSKPLPTTDTIDCLTFGAVGRWVLFADRRDVYVWDWQSEKDIETFPQGGASALAMSADGSVLITGRGGITETRVWDFASQEMRYQVKVGEPRSLAISPDGTLFAASSGYAHKIDLRRVSDGELIHKIDTEGVSVGSLIFSPDGRRLVVSPGTYVWDVETGERIAPRGPGHVDAVVDLAYSTDGTRLGTVGRDGMAAVWNADTGKLVHLPDPGSVNWQAGIALTDEIIASTGHNRTVRVWDAQTGALRHTLPGHGHVGSRYPVAITPTGEVVSFGIDWMLRVHDGTTGKLKAEHDLTPIRDTVEPDHDDDHDHEFPAGKFSADGSVLGIAYNGKTWLYGLELADIVREIPHAGDYGFALSPDGSQIVIGDMVFDVGRGEELLTIPVDGGVEYAAYSQDGKHVALATFDHATRAKLFIYELATGQQRRLPDLPTRIASLAFRPDGRQIAVGFEDASVLAWDVDALEVVAGESNVRTFVESLERLQRISGTVVDADGRPLVGTRVLLREAPVNPRGEPVSTENLAETVSDADGRFAFADVPIPENPPWENRGRMFDVVAFPERRDLAITWRHVRDEDNVELRVGAGRRLSGMITDADGNPLADASVGVQYLMSIRHITQADLELGRWPRMDDGRFLSLARVLSVRTKVDGTFTLTGLPAESGLVLEVSHPEFLSKTLYATSAESLDEQTRLMMKRNVQARAVFAALEPGHRVEIEVVYDDSGERVRGAHLFRPYQAGRPALPPGEMTTEVSEDGTFLITGVDHGTHRFHAHAPKPGDARSLYLSGSAQVELVPGERDHKLTIRLPVNNLVDVRGTTVHAQTGELLAGVDLVYTEATVEAKAYMGLRTGPDGSFEIAVAPGKYRFFIPDPGRARVHVEELTVVAGEAVDELKFEVLPDPVYRGTVTDADGAPVAGATLETSARSGEIGVMTVQTTTDAEGRFELTGLYAQIAARHELVLTDRVEVLVRAPERGLAGTFWLDPPDGTEILEIEVSLQPTTSVSGRVLDAETGDPLADVKVSLVKHGRGHMRNGFQAMGEDVLTDADGRFTVHGALHGVAHEVWFAKEGYDGHDVSDGLNRAGREDIVLGDVSLKSKTPQPAPWPVEVPNVSDLEPADAVKILIESHRLAREGFELHRRTVDPPEFRAPGDATWQFARQMMPIIEAQPSSELALQACLWLIETNEFNNSTGERLHPLKQSAISLLLEHFVDGPDLAPQVQSMIYLQSGWGIRDQAKPLTTGRRLMESADPKVSLLARLFTAEWLLDTRRRWRPTATPEDIDAARPLLEECVRDGGSVEVYDQVSVADRARDILEQLPNP